jgi:hypothetical protein
MDFADPLCMSKELRKLMMIARKLPVCSPVNLAIINPSHVCAGWTD